MRMRSYFWLLPLCVLALARWAAAEPQPQQKYALLVGINNYKYPDRISPLDGSLNDVENLRQVLMSKFDFPAENIVVLKEAEATHEGIINAIKALIAKAKEGDIVVFDYSGHGSQMPDATGKLISGRDETMVPYDSRDTEGKVFDISGTELHPLLQQLAAKTRNVTFILDSCHSGTLVRGARVRGIPADTRTPPPLVTGDGAGLSRNIGSVEGAGSLEGAVPKFAFLAAASSRENAFEDERDGKANGAFTYLLVRQLRAARPGATYRDIMDAVAGELTANFPGQHPSLEGAEADQQVFGDSTSLARNYVVASPSSLSSDHITLHTGQIEGATVGSVFDVYPPGSRKFAPPETPVVRVRISAVSDETAEAVPLTKAKIVAASRAVEREHRYPNQRMRLFIDGPADSTVIVSIQAALAEVKYITLVDKPMLCNLQLRLANDKLALLAKDATSLSPPVPAGDPEATARIVNQLKGWAKWFGVLSIHNAQSDIALHFKLTPAAPKGVIARTGSPILTVQNGDTVQASLTNVGERDVYVAMLDLSTDGSISFVYPAIQGEQGVLKGGTALERSFRASVPPGRSYVTDVVKVFASYKPIDLTPLIQRSVRSVPDGQQADNDPLDELLNDSAGTTREITPLAQPLDLATWTTTQAALAVHTH